MVAVCNLYFLISRNIHWVTVVFIYPVNLYGQASNREKVDQKILYSDTFQAVIIIRFKFVISVCFRFFKLLINAA